MICLTTPKNSSVTVISLSSAVLVQQRVALLGSLRVFEVKFGRFCGVGCESWFGCSVVLSSRRVDASTGSIGRGMLEGWMRVALEGGSFTPVSTSRKVHGI